MPWLVRDGQVLASLELAERRRDRRRGLLGRDDFTGALLIRPARSVHTLGMRFRIDVAFLDKNDVVIDMVQMAAGRICRPRWKARTIVEATAGSFERWGLELGDVVEVAVDE
jgi:uncharacterized protein